jgi:hypothetical protein
MARWPYLTHFGTPKQSLTSAGVVNDTDRIHPAALPKKTRQDTSARRGLPVPQAFSMPRVREFLTPTLQHCKSYRQCRDTCRFGGILEMFGV